jgi:hypothetical protein
MTIEKMSCLVTTKKGIFVNLTRIKELSATAYRIHQNGNDFIHPYASIITRE